MCCFKLDFHIPPSYNMKEIVELFVEVFDLFLLNIVLCVHYRDMEEL